MRIVVLRALKLGDFLTGVPAYRALRRAYPQAHIALAAPRGFSALVELLDGALDEVVDAQPLAPLSPELHGADLGVNLHGKGPQSHRVLLDAGVRRMIAFRNDDVPASREGARYDPQEHEVARWCRLLHEAGIPENPLELDIRRPPLTVPRRARGGSPTRPASRRRTSTRGGRASASSPRSSRRRVGWSAATPASRTSRPPSGGRRSCSSGPSRRARGARRRGPITACCGTARRAIRTRSGSIPGCSRSRSSG